MKSRIFFISLLLSCWACNNIEDASPSERKTFIRFYESNKPLVGVAAEQIEGGGYILLGNEVTLDGVNGVIIFTDRNGDEIPAKRIVLPNVSPRAMKISGENFFVTGDRIKFDPSSENLFDLTVTSAIVYRISMSGGDTTSFVASDTVKTAKTDFHGSSVTLDRLGNLVLLGTYKEAKLVAFDRPFITVLSPASFDTVWWKRYDVLERDYVNSKSVHTTQTGEVVWASALLREAGDISRTFLAIPYVRDSSIFVNNDLFGETTDQKLLASDLQPTNSGFGYGLVGSWSSPTGTQSNMFFVRVNRAGDFVAGTERFFDGDLSSGNPNVAEGQSSTEDTGDAITSTQDGGFILAGSMLSTPTKGNGARDILLVKIDASGNMVWTKTIGGEGDETVGSIRETEDGGLLICGTNNVSGLSSIFIMKTDSNGDLKD